MCGIAGIIDFRGRPIDPAVLTTCCDRLAHRGPDDRGIWTHTADDFSVGLAHTRLSVIDPTPEAHQPMLDAAGVRAIAYNGELYNYRELAARLSRPLRTRSDTEVVLAACHTHGPAALETFDGMWALAYVDTQTRTGHLSRDPFGIKPLYYAVHDDRLIFASELRTLTAIPGLPLEIDPHAIALYLQLGYIPHPWTIYRGVRKLPPGCLLRFDAHGPHEPQRYHFLPGASCAREPDDPTQQERLYAETVHRLRDTIAAAVVRQRVAHVPLGAFLSGGLDSSIVTACLARAGGAVKTFSIGYAEHPRYDETAYASAVAAHLGTEHHAFRLTFRDVLDHIGPVLDHLGEPFGDSSILPTSLVSRCTRQHVTVALSGDGGDELFAGYWRYRGHALLARYEAAPPALRRIVERLLTAAPSARTNRRLDRLRQLRKLLRAAGRPDPMSRHLAWAALLTPDALAGLIDQPLATAAATTIRTLYSEAPWSLRRNHVPTGRSDLGHPFGMPDPLADVLLADLAVGLPGDMLFKVDTASMFHSLEVRVPLLSPDVVRLASLLPMSYRLHRGTTKRILKDAFRDWLPSDIIDRPKMGFEVPVGEFLRRELRDRFHDTVSASTLQSLGLSPTAVNDLYAAHAARREDHTEILWSLLVLCHWARNRNV